MLDANISNVFLHHAVFHYVMLSELIVVFLYYLICETFKVWLHKNFHILYNKNVTINSKQQTEKNMLHTYGKGLIPLI